MFTFYLHTIIKLYHVYYLRPPVKFWRTVPQNFKTGDTTL